MAMDAGGLYIVIAPIAAAFAGFGSLASGIGQRHGGDDARVDAFRLATMLFSSLSATLLGLLPATLESLLVADRTAVRVCALLGLIAIVVYVPIGALRARKLRGVTGFSKSGGLANSVCLLTAFAAFALSASGAWADRAAGLYLLGLVGLLSSSIVMFWRVIASMLRPSHSP
jgi:hypothetical protein